jgi:hypothetical protein
VSSEQVDDAATRSGWGRDSTSNKEGEEVIAHAMKLSSSMSPKLVIMWFKRLSIKIQIMMDEHFVGPWKPTLGWVSATGSTRADNTAGNFTIYSANPEI